MSKGRSPQHLEGADGLFWMVWRAAIMEHVPIQQVSRPRCGNGPRRQIGQFSQLAPRQRATEDKGGRRCLARLRRLTSLQPSRWERRGHYPHEVDPAGRHYPSFGVIFEPLRL